MPGETVRQIVGFRESEALNVARRELEWALHGRPEIFRLKDSYVDDRTLRAMRAQYEELTGDFSLDGDARGSRRFAETVASYALSIKEPGNENVLGGYLSHLKGMLGNMSTAPIVMRANLAQVYAALATRLTRSARFAEKDEARSLGDLAQRARQLSGALVKYRLLFKPARLEALLFTARLLLSAETAAHGERMLRSIEWEGLDKPKFPPNFDDLTAAITGYNREKEGIVLTDEVPGPIRRGPRGNRGGAPQTPASKPPVTPPAAAPAGGHSAAPSITSRIVGARIYGGEVANPIHVPPQFQNAGTQVAWGGMAAGGMPWMRFPSAFAPIPMMAIGSAVRFQGLPR